MISKSILTNTHKKGYKEKEVYEAYKIFFGTLVSGPRLKIINLLRSGGKNVSEITKELNMNQSSVSHNLSRLKSCGFLNSKTDKKFRYYELNKKTIKPLMSLIDKHMAGHCIHIMDKIKKEDKK